MEGFGLNNPWRLNYIWQKKQTKKPKEMGAQLAETIEYTGKTPPTSVLDMTINKLIVRFQ